MTTSRSARRRFTLDDLFQDTSPRGEGVTDLEAAKEIRLDRIVPDPSQPRRTMDRGRFEELVASVRQEGVLVPIEVSYDSEQNLYVIVHGERRWRAANEAGLATIPALVREVDGRQRILHQLMENILREDLNAVDRARALRALKEAMGGVAWELVADAVGIRRSRLFQLLDVVKLPDDLQEDIRAGRLSEKHGRAFKDLPPPQQAALRDLVLEEGLSGDETLRVAQTLRRGPAEFTVRDAFATARAARTPQPAPPAAVAEPGTTPATLAVTQPAERVAIADRAGADAAAANGGPGAGKAGPALQGGGEAPPEATEATCGATVAPAAVVPPATVSPLANLEDSFRALAALLPDLAAASLEAAERQRAVALLGELRDLVDAALTQLASERNGPDAETPSSPVP